MIDIVGGGAADADGAATADLESSMREVMM